MINPKYNRLAVGLVFIALFAAMGYLSFKLAVSYQTQKFDFTIRCQQNKTWT
jgi:hypothetical protein